ncbi:hypothetical protein A1351_09955 [Methylosinus sp. R-45379]|uniref:hypothetical protein n=1 Tax=Methylosinus sp. R-45379 TaxID=980563 RepID=UPI0007C9777B|nr:hypothetical protein [Methylosinus sp. R-45379]OAI30213.1 hypothetical protein A1351_09955 [Methylosinus sp. R-45379]
MTDFAKNLFDFIKSVTLATAIGAPTAAAGVFVYERPDSALMLLSKVQSVEIGDFKLALGQKAFEINPDLGAKKNSMGDLIARARNLGPREVERLIHLLPLDAASMDRLGADAVKCDYDRADARTRLFAVIDKSLEEKKLVEIMRRDELIDQKTHEVYGPPSACYRVVLTALGADVKSMIVSELTRYFTSELDVGAPPAAVKPASDKPASERPVSERSRTKFAQPRRDAAKRIAAR